MWNNNKYDYSLNEVIKKVISNLPSQYKFSSENGGGRGQFDKEWWSRIVVKRGNSGNQSRTFEMIFVFSFPSFPFSFKPKVLIKVRELYDHTYTIYKEQYVKLPNLKEDSIFAETVSDTSVTWKIHTGSCENNAQYVFENIRISYWLLDSILSTKLPTATL
ncbi:MAG: hypothetical protein E6H08_16555 [Bacteroidetes bacterium]|nr:MAG: hypothetical protein E6H08_16555 [Bacteroidota bacterium]